MPYFAVQSQLAQIQKSNVGRIKKGKWEQGKRNNRTKKNPKGAKEEADAKIEVEVGKKINREVQGQEGQTPIPANLKKEQKILDDS